MGSAGCKADQGDGQKETGGTHHGVHLCSGNTHVAGNQGIERKFRRKSIRTGHWFCCTGWP
jgi:hypothetical protein